MKRAVMIIALACGLGSRATAQLSVEPCDDLDGEVAGEGFGFSFDADADWMAVGAPLANGGAGRVYIYERDGDEWDLYETLDSPEPGRYRFFGSAVAVGDDRVAIGAPGLGVEGDRRGTVYVYRARDDGLDLRATLTRGDAGARFGASVDLAGQVLVAGAPKQGEMDFGRAWVFERSGSDWDERAVLGGGVAQEDSGFSFAVATDGDVIVVGVPTADGVLNRTGVIAIYRRAGGDWPLEDVVFSEDGRPNDRFGTSVAVADGMVVAGGERREISVTGVGVFVHRDGHWERDGSLFASGPEESLFGTALLIDHERIFVGAYSAHTVDAGAGAVIMFERLGLSWRRAVRLVASDPAHAAHFGMRLARSGGDIIVAAHQAGDRGRLSTLRAEDIAACGVLCPDLTGDGRVIVADLVALLSEWGECQSCYADLDGNGIVEVADMLLLLAAWGDC